MTVDELLGVGEERIKDEINRYQKRSIELKNKGEVKENYALWKEAYATFPEDHRVQQQYIDALWCVCASEPLIVVDGVIQPWDEKRQEKGREIFAIGNQLLSTCADRAVTDSVVQVLCYTAKYIGDIPLAKSYAEKLGSFCCTKESVLEWVLEGGDGIEQAQGNILSYLDMLTTSISAVRVKMSPAPEEQEKFERLCIDLWERVLGDKPLGFYHCRVADTYSRKSYSKNYSSSESFLCLKALDGNLYSFLRENARFTALIDRLQRAAHETD